MNLVLLFTRKAIDILSYINVKLRRDMIEYLQTYTTVLREDDLIRLSETAF